LLNLLGAKRGELDILAPTHWVLPSGRRARLDYGAGDQPVLSAQLQDMFGMRQLPRLARGRVGVVAHLLSPARRPVAVTSDLESFWRNGYKLVRKEYRGRYPKHAWPEDPP
jgi:ATP-dependent helicase HrpB